MNKFPWNCGECPMLHTYDLSIDDLTHICLWSKSQIDDCDRYKSAECPMEEHDKQIRTEAEREFQNSDYWNDYLAKVISDERAKFAEWLHENYTVNDNHNEEVSVEDLLWEYSHK